MQQFSEAAQGELDTVNVMSSVQSPTAPAILANGTINTAGVSLARVAPAGAVAGIILQAGTLPDQRVFVVNEAAAANTVTFAALGTSNVLDGVSDVIAGQAGRLFAWDSAIPAWVKAS